MEKGGLRGDRGHLPWFRAVCGEEYVSGVKSSKMFWCLWTDFFKQNVAHLRYLEACIIVYWSDDDDKTVCIFVRVSRDASISPLLIPESPGHTSVKLCILRDFLFGKCYLMLVLLLYLICKITISAWSGRFKPVSEKTSILFTHAMFDCRALVSSRLAKIAWKVSPSLCSCRSVSMAYTLLPYTIHINKQIHIRG